MAIIIEEQKPPKNWGTVIAISAVIILIFAGVYFLFFKKPMLIEMVAPASLEKTKKLSQLKFDPAGIQNNEVFKSLRQYTTLPTAGELGRNNPFLPF